MFPKLILVYCLDVYSAYGNKVTRGVFLLVKRTLGEKVNLVHVDAGVGLLIVFDIKVNSS